MSPLWRGIKFYAFVEMTICAVAHFAEQKIGGQVILSSGTSEPKGAYANGMLVLLQQPSLSRMLRSRKGTVQRKHTGSLP
jgi:hypothetical protein